MCTIPIHGQKASVKSTLRVLNVTPRKCVYAPTLFSVHLTPTLVLMFLHSAIVISVTLLGVQNEHWPTLVKCQ